MRKQIVAGNWKMNKTLNEGITLVDEILKDLENHYSGKPEVIVAPPFILLERISRICAGKIGVAAQNCASESAGAYTGEVSAAMIRSTGATHVIIGHSERRHYYGENDEILRKKVDLALENHLTPIFCCGEILDERNSHNHFEVVSRQITNAIFHLDAESFGRIIIAYEPVWAIGTGVTATPDQAQEMHAFIRNLVAGHYSKEIAGNLTILYGGSCKPSNAAELFANPDVDGGLIGGASLVADDFTAIIRSF